MAYPGYGAAPGGVPAFLDRDTELQQDPLYGYFSAVAGQRDMSASMGFAEFRELWQVLNGWKNTFASYDRDHSGTVEAHELQQAITTMGYNLSPQAMNCIMKRYSLHGRIPFDEFVSCCVRLRALTDQFRRRDTSQSGSAMFQYDDVAISSGTCGAEGGEGGGGRWGDSKT
ncbi:hypothetical protein INR49_020422 [Caranx melampygus]|nr:hypothetical protein INR49_020422 [Caranx melampygus]